MFAVDDGRESSTSRGGGRWIESIDPNTGRTFYADTTTRTTRWDPPPGWGVTTTSNDGDDVDDIDDIDDDALPDGWEEMIDKSTGRAFYVDHSTRATTWTRPRRGEKKKKKEKRREGEEEDRRRGGGEEGGGGVTGGNLLGATTTTTTTTTTTLNRHGSHKRWDENPRVGSRRGAYAGGDDNDNRLRRHRANKSSESHPGPPPLDFVVVSVPDSMRSTCPGCNMGFTYTRRRHHCRLCGDVFCDPCSSTRTELPLVGKEYESPVRVCDLCARDVNRGNYFATRRYLTPLQLFDVDGNSRGGGGRGDAAAASPADAARGGSGEVAGEITSRTVAASLYSLYDDVETMVDNGVVTMMVPPRDLVRAVGRHLKDRANTAEYAVSALAGLLVLGSVSGDDSYAMAVCGWGEEGGGGASASSSSTVGRGGGRKRGEIVNDVLAILEWNGTDGRSLSALEQATKVVYYITDPNFVEGAISKLVRGGGGGGGATSNEEKKGNDDNRGPVDVDEAGETMVRDLHRIDVHRAFRAMLDHATSSESPSLQRWATASLRHLIAEDRRRACWTSPSPDGGGGTSKYESFMTRLVSTGGIMILCSLLSSDDGDTRNHAASALEAIVVSTREIRLASDASSSSLGPSRAGRGTADDSAIVDAIVSNGGCGPALAHLLISSDEAVSRLGCSLASSLISPLLTDPRGSGRALRRCVAGPDNGGGASFPADDDGLSSYRRAALALVVPDGPDEVSCLPLLIQIMRSGAEEGSRGGTPSRSIKLQVAAGECLAAISLAIGHIVSDASADSKDKSSYGSLYARAKKALEIMENERIFDMRIKIAWSLIHPQDPNGMPTYNRNGVYMVKLWFNGVERRVLVDDLLPVDDKGELLCSHTKNNDGCLELWVPILEKAYMKLCGGYDFPGSNSGVDLFCLTGWIPESIILPENPNDVRDFETPAERAWDRLYNAYSFGDCLATVSTSKALTEEKVKKVGLFTGHAYAVLKIVWASNGTKLLQLKNPWASKDDSYNMSKNPQYTITLSEEAIRKKATLWLLLSRHVTKQEQESGEVEAESKLNARLLRI
ncbi:hypothetical protein ACHAW5_007448 [Stephanodiscus triporus]|uniref:HECT-type E3 ubiquitin transferase n=1 Tax=Stephanodiscus triporus TaxID=2934178 RepID=A0ABD3NNL1_9STRA